MTDSNGFRQRLISARSIKGLSQQALAEASGVAAAQVSRYESGKSFPRPEVVAKLSRALVVDFDWLLKGIGKGPAGTGYVPALIGFHGDPNCVTIQLTPELHSRLQRAAESRNLDLASEIVGRLELSLSGNPNLTLEQRLEIAEVEQKESLLRLRKNELRREIDALIARVRASRDANTPEDPELLSRIGQLSWDEAEVRDDHSELLARLDTLRGEDRPPLFDGD